MSQTPNTGAPSARGYTNMQAAVQRNQQQGGAGRSPLAGNPGQPSDVWNTPMPSWEAMHAASISPTMPSGPMRVVPGFGADMTWEQLAWMAGHHGGLGAPSQGSGGGAPSTPTARPGVANPSPGLYGPTPYAAAGNTYLDVQRGVAANASGRPGAPSITDLVAQRNQIPQLAAQANMQSAYSPGAMVQLEQLYHNPNLGAQTVGNALNTPYYTPPNAQPGTARNPYYGAPMPRPGMPQQQGGQK